MKKSEVKVTVSVPKGLGNFMKRYGAGWIKSGNASGKFKVEETEKIFLPKKLRNPITFEDIMLNEEDATKRTVREKRERESDKIIKWMVSEEGKEFMKQMFSKTTPENKKNEQEPICDAILSEERASYIEGKGCDPPKGVLSFEKEIHTGRYEIVIPPEKLNIERIVREAEYDGIKAFMVVGTANVLVGIQSDEPMPTVVLNKCKEILWVESPLYSVASGTFYIDRYAQGKGEKFFGGWEFGLVSLSSLPEAKQAISDIVSRMPKTIEKKPNPRKRFVVRTWK